MSRLARFGSSWRMRTSTTLAPIGSVLRRQGNYAVSASMGCLKMLHRPLWTTRLPQLKLPPNLRNLLGLKRPQAPKVPLQAALRPSEYQKDLRQEDHLESPPSALNQLVSLPLPPVQLELELQPPSLKGRRRKAPSGTNRGEGAKVPPGGSVEVKNELTGQIWKFSDIGAMQEPDGSFVLRGHWPPGLYKISNRSRLGIRLTLSHESHFVQAGETWRFFAHQETGSGAELIERRGLMP